MTSRLVIGTPRIPAKPPRRVPCTEPDPPNGEYLLDPGFENFIDNFGTATIPPRTGVVDKMHWVQDGQIDGRDQWTVVNTEPDEGTWHAEVDIPISGSSGTNARWLEPIRLMHCYGVGNAFQSNAGRVEPGAPVLWEVRAKVSSVADGEPALSLPVDFLTEEFFNAGAGTSLVSLTDLTTSYATYTASGNAPSNAAWMRAFIWPRHKVVSSTTKTVRVDACTLTTG